jgi:outer membrane lipoprotein-sorting protein
MKVVKPTSEVPPYLGAEEMLAALNKTGDKVENIKGVMTIRVLNAEGKAEESMSGYVAFAPPDKMSFSYVGPLGMIFFAAVRSGQEVVFYLPQQRRAYVGSVSDIKSGPMNNTLLITPFSKPRGEVFLVEHSGAVSTLYGLTKVEEGWEIMEKLTVDRNRMIPTERRFFTAGVEALRITYLQYTEIDGVSIPVLVSIRNTGEGADAGEVEIGLKKVELNGTLNPEVFDTGVDEGWIVDGIENFVIPKY